MNIYEKLEDKYPGRWATKNPSAAVNEAEGRTLLFIDLYIDDRTFTGSSSMNTDYSIDITEKLLEKAVISAYKKTKIAKVV